MAPGQRVTIAYYLMPIADREPLMWIVRERRTAFPSYRRRDAERLAAGDRLLLYTARGCFHNPTRDRGRVIGVATVKHAPKDLAEPIRFGEREFPIGVGLEFDALVPRDAGVELAPIVASLPKTLANPPAWSATLRRALVPFDDEEAEQIVRHLGDRSPTPQTIESYTTVSGL